jgi:hypothetical protein
MNDQQKHECYDNAVKALPDEMSVRDLLVFMHSVCAAFNLDSGSIGLALMTSSNEADPEVVEISFKNEKLQKLLGR